MTFIIGNINGSENRICLEEASADVSAEERVDANEKIECLTQKSVARENSRIDQRR